VPHSHHLAADNEAEYAEVLMDELPIPIRGSITVQNLARFVGKTTIGDYTADSDDLLSTFIIADWSGGFGIEDITEGADVGRYWAGTLDSTRPRQLTMSRRTREIPQPGSIGGNQTFYPLGDIGSVFYGAWGTQIRAFSGFPDLVVSGTHTMAFAPTGKSVRFAGTGSLRLFVPHGTNGYSHYAGSANATHVAASGSTPAAVAFEVWDNKLWCLAVDGGLWTTLDGTTWVAPTAAQKIDQSFSPRHLVPYYAAAGHEALNAVTDEGIFVYNGTDSKWVRSGLKYPPHPYQGLASAVWDNRLYVSVGMGVHFTEGAIVGSMGPDRDFGVPSPLRGHITDLLAEYNALYALMQGAVSVGSFDETLTMEEMPFDESLYTGPVSSLPWLARYTGRGWHPSWRGPNVSGTITHVVISKADGKYRIVWGAGTGCYYQNLPVDFSNPRHDALEGTGDFELGTEDNPQYLEMGDFDAGMASFWKLGSGVFIKCANATATETVGIDYSLDKGNTWTELGTVSDTDDHRFLFGEDGKWEGLPFRRIRLRVRMESGSTETSPVMEYMVLEYIKVPKIGYSWRFTVPLDHPEGWKGASPQEIDAKLEDLLGQSAEDEEYVPPKFFIFTVGSGRNKKSYRARITQVIGSDPTGKSDEDRVRNVVVVGIPT
jgi:hypothetical protein